MFYEIIFSMIKRSFELFFAAMLDEFDKLKVNLKITLYSIKAVAYFTRYNGA